MPLEPDEIERIQKTGRGFGPTFSAPSDPDHFKEQKSNKFPWWVVSIATAMLGFIGYKTIEGNSSPSATPPVAHDAATPGAKATPRPDAVTAVVPSASGPQEYNREATEDEQSIHAYFDKKLNQVMQEIRNTQPGGIGQLENANDRKADLLTQLAVTLNQLKDNGNYAKMVAGKQNLTSQIEAFEAEADSYKFLDDNSYRQQSQQYVLGLQDLSARFIDPKSIDSLTR